MAQEIEAPVSLHAESPYELRVDGAKKVSESAIKQALDTGDVGFIHSFTTGSAVDGPGVRAVAWTAGCQFRCLYCHNPDTWSLTNGTPVPLDRAIDEIKKYRQGLRVMNGGFTLSGGEPLMQDRFAVRLFAALRKAGIHNTLDTNGLLGDRLSDDELMEIDLVMLDLKSFDPEIHLRVAGKDNGPTLDFARRLAVLRRPMWIRYVLVPDLTDDEIDVGKTAKFAGSLGNVERVDVLPFHQMGRFKWQKLNLQYELETVQPPSNELVERVCSQFRAEGLKAY